MAPRPRCESFGEGEGGGGHGSGLRRLAETTGAGDAARAQTHNSACGGALCELETYDEEHFSERGAPRAAKRRAPREALILVVNAGIVAAVLAECRGDHRASDESLKKGVSGKGSHPGWILQRGKDVGGGSVEKKVGQPWSCRTAACPTARARFVVEEPKYLPPQDQQSSVRTAPTAPSVFQRRRDSYYDEIHPVGPGSGSPPGRL